MNCLSWPKIGRIQVISASHLPLTSQSAHWDSEGSKAGRCWPRTPWLRDGELWASTCFPWSQIQPAPVTATTKTEKLLHDTRGCHLWEKKGTFKGSTSGTDLWKNMPKVWGFSMPLPLIFTPELQTGMKRRGAIAGHASGWGPWEQNKQRPKSSAPSPKGLCLCLHIAMLWGIPDPWLHELKSRMSISVPLPQFLMPQP